MSNKDVALLVAEAPWFSPKDNVGQATGLPFFEGVSRLVNASITDSRFNIYSSNYYDNSSLEKALDHLVNTREPRQILYLGGHGDGKKVSGATISKASSLIRDRGEKIKGLILSSCWGGLSDKISKATEYGFDPKSGVAKMVNGPNWVVAYKHPVAWFESAMIETSLIKTFAEAYMDGGVNSREAIFDQLVFALRAFSIEDNIGFDQNDNASLSVKDTLRFWIRPQGAEYPTEITDEIFVALSDIQGYSDDE